MRIYAINQSSRAGQSVNACINSEEHIARCLVAPSCDHLHPMLRICCIEHWSVDNYLHLHSLKCKYMIMSHKRSPTLPENPLMLLGSVLEWVNCHKYLGVLLTSDLSWSSHVGSICTKARHVLGLLYRRFHGSTSQDSLKQLYLSLVRSHMEYACQVWDPHLAKDKKAIEDVQKFALKMITSKWDSSYDELLDLSKLKPLEERRADLKLGLLFKTVHNLCFFTDGLWEFRNCRSGRTSHSQQLSIPFAHTNSYFYSFFPHTSSNWNMLNETCISSQSYSSFMHTLRHWFSYIIVSICISFYLGAHMFSALYYCVSCAFCIKYYRQKKKGLATVYTSYCHLLFSSYSCLWSMVWPATNNSSATACAIKGKNCRCMPVKISIPKRDRHKYMYRCKTRCEAGLVALH